MCDPLSRENARGAPCRLWLTALLLFLAACNGRDSAVPVPEPTLAQRGEAALAAQRERMAVIAPERVARDFQTDYEIEVMLDAAEGRLVGKQRLVYHNQSGDILDSLPFHLYLNAFRDEQSVFARAWLENNGAPPPSFGAIDLTRFELDGRDVLDQAVYPHEPDHTVVTFATNGPLFPGEAVTVTCEFTANLPETASRSVANGDFFFVAQWFPKIGVWEATGRNGRAGAWVCPPYHLLTEFYADFGRYRVVLDVPADYEVGATGVLVDERQQPDTERKQLTFIAEQVHDFAWSASPHFLRAQRTFQMSAEEVADARTRFGLTEAQATLPPVEMILLLQPQHAHQAERHFTAMRQAILATGLRLGHYPYPAITMIDPIYEATEASGMEYPMLVSLGSHRWTARDDSTLEDLIYHEFIHQYFQGMVATNEFEAAWLDEGFTAYLSAKLVQEHFSDRYYMRSYVYQLSFTPLWWLGFAPYQPVQDMRANALRLPVGARAAQAGPLFRAQDIYYNSVYDRAALMLFQLERLLGEAAMVDLMRAWFESQRFKHPNGADFVRFAQQRSGRSLEPFFEQWLNGDGFLDYAVAQVRTYSDEAAADENEREVYRVIVRNHGERIMPLQVLLVFEDGTERRLDWAGGRDWVISGRAASPPAAVILDPEHLLILDAYRANNVWRAEARDDAARAAAEKTGGVLQHWLQVLAGAIL